MLFHRAIWVALWFFVAQHASAQLAPCGGVAAPDFIAFSPESPNTSQAVTITFGLINVDPQSIAAQVQGNIIDVTLTAISLGLATPPAATCDAVVVGPLAAGTYTVNFFVLDPSVPVPVSRFVDSTSLSVAAAPPSAIPATSDLALLALATLVSLAAWRVFGHRNRSQAR